MSLSQQKSDQLRDLLWNEFGMDCYFKMQKLLGETPDETIIGWDWERLPLRANIMKDLYQRHLQLPEKKFIDLQTLTSKFNAE